MAAFGRRHPQLECPQVAHSGPAAFRQKLADPSPSASEPRNRESGPSQNPGAYFRDRPIAANADFRHVRRVQYTLRTIAILLLAPPVTFLALAHFAPHNADWLWTVATGVAPLAALVALRTSRWALHVQLGVGLIYLLAAVKVLPILALLAACTAGNCI